MTDHASPPSRRRFLSALLATAGGSLAVACGVEAPSTSAFPSLALGQLAGGPRPAALFGQSRAILSEPLLQNPGADSVSVIWFSEVEGGEHEVYVGAGERLVRAETRPMSHMLEDEGSQVVGRSTAGIAVPQARQVFRHEARVTGLSPGQRVPYFAVSRFQGQAFRSTGETTLQPLPRPGQAVRVLLTSDQQNNRMAPANFQKVAEAGPPVDFVFFPGDFVSQPNRGSEWFDRDSHANPAFFPSLQGTMRRWRADSPFAGGRILQNAALFGCLGNHEYPGRWRMDPRTDNPGNTGPRTINAQDNDPQPRWYAEARYEELKSGINPSGDPALRAKWIEDNSYEWTTYREMWSLPEGPEGKAYYSQRIGDIFLVSLDANRIWRSWGANQRGKFTEAFDTGTGRITANADVWGFGDIEFRAFGRGSRQHQWLQDTLASTDARSARWRIVLSHQTMAGLGDNVVPVQAEIRSTVELTDGRIVGPFLASEWRARWPQVNAARQAGLVRYIRHEYPLAADQWLTDVEPVLLERGVQLVHCGHSHLWNRTRAGPLHYLETANVGNSFGGFFYATPRPGVSPSQGPRGTQPGNAAWTNATIGQNRTALTWNPADYPTHGEPHGRPMIMPTEFNPMREWAGAAEDLPFIASNALTAFTIFDSGSGVVESFVYDTRLPDGPTRLFDRFRLDA